MSYDKVHAERIKLIKVLKGTDQAWTKDLTKDWVDDLEGFSNIC